MGTSRIRMGHQRNDPVPANTFKDFDWIQAHWDELLQQYGEGFIIVFEEKVLGFGATYLEAVADAEQNLPASIEEATPVVESIYHRLPFTRMQLRPIQPPPENE